MKVNVTKLLESILEKNASDLHLSVGSVPLARIAGALIPLTEYEPLIIDDVEAALSQLLDDAQREVFEVNKELDFSAALGNKARVRVNVYSQKGYPSIAMRVIPLGVPQLKDLSLPEALGHLTNLKQGLVLVVGPTGHGKSTTVAAMLDKINHERAEHIITIEDPIEYIFTNDKCLIEQRELYLDTHSWDIALKSVFRQDPNIVVIGELRDTETISAALEISETGHLVIGTLHTNSAAQTVERIISAFPKDKGVEVGTQLSYVLEVVVSQRLVPGKDGRLYPAVEILLGSEAVKNLIRENKTHMIDNIISTSGQLGMQSIEKSLADLVKSGKVEEAEAMKFTSNPDGLKRFLR